MQVILVDSYIRYAGHLSRFLSGTDTYAGVITYTGGSICGLTGSAAAGSLEGEKPAGRTHGPPAGTNLN